MAARISIKKVVTAIFWCFAGAGGIVLLVAAIRYRNSNVCKGYKIEITGPKTIDRLFIDRKGINDLLTAAGAGKGQGKPIQSFDLHRLETTLEKNVWIRDAQLFFDNNGILQVRISEREPAARIFTTGGNSFYIDSSAVELPLQERFAAHLPVFTGYPATKIKTTGPDSLLTTGVLQLSSFIRHDSFWMAQIAQVDITPEKTFELEPEIGDHRITFGDATDLAAKFHRLFVFYDRVLSRVGMDKYQRIDVSYEGQVIGTKKGSGQSRYDSLQGMEKIRQLIRSAQQLQPDTLRHPNMLPLENTQESIKQLNKIN